MIAAATAAAALSIWRELEKRRKEKARAALLRRTPVSEKDAYAIIEQFQTRHRRYQAAVVATIVGFALMPLAMLSGIGVIGLIAGPLILGGFMVGIESYKCPRCAQPPVNSWRLGLSSYPVRCGSCDSVLRRGEEP